MNAWITRCCTSLGLVLACSAPDSSSPRADAESPPTVVDVRERPVVEPEQPRAPTPPCRLVDPPSGLVDLALVIPSVIVVAGYHTADNFTGAPLPGYEAAGAWLEREAADALVEVAAALGKAGLRLIIYDAYRPRSASEAMVEWASANGQEWLLEQGWVAARSAHNRGRAIDVGLADAQGVALDMGSAWDQFDSSSFLRGVDGPALERRLLLRDAMVAGGFTPYAREWWHFGFESDNVVPALDRPYACR